MHYIHMQLIHWVEESRALPIQYELFDVLPSLLSEPFPKPLNDDVMGTLDDHRGWEFFLQHSRWVTGNGC
jgi:hypothetical protein